MSLTRPSWVTNSIQSLANLVTGQATSIKALWDKSASDVKIFITAMCTEIEAQFATKAEVQSIVLGQIPPGMPNYYLHTKADGTAVEWSAVPITDLTPVWNEISRSRKNELFQMLLNSGLNNFDNIYGDSFDSTAGINTSLSTNYLYDSVNKSVKMLDTTNIAIGGTALSDSNYSTQTADKAFDSNLTTYWASNHNTADQNNVSWVGYNFGSAKTIRRISIKQGTGANPMGVTSAKFQVSSNGSTWTDVQVLTLNIDGNVQTIDIAAPQSAQYARILATSNVTSGSLWAVYEFDMYEVGNSTIVYLNSHTSNGIITKAIIEALQTLRTGAILYYFSRDDGITFTQCALDTVTDISAQPTGSSIVIKIVMTGNSEILGISDGGVVA